MHNAKKNANLFADYKGNVYLCGVIKIKLDKKA